MLSSITQDGFITDRGGSLETDLSTKQNQAETFSRIPESYANRGGSAGPVPAACQRAEKTHRRRLLQGTVTQLPAPGLVGISTIRRGESFPPEIRLRHTRDHRRVKKVCMRIRTRYFMVLVRPGALQWSRVGFTVSRRVGQAVTRNHLKRLLREAFRRHYSLIDGRWDIVFIARPSAARLDATEVSREVKMLFSRTGTRR